MKEKSDDTLVKAFSGSTLAQTGATKTLQAKRALCSLGGAMSLQFILACMSPNSEWDVSIVQGRKRSYSTDEPLHYIGEAHVGSARTMAALGSSGGEQEQVLTLACLGVLPVAQLHTAPATLMIGMLSRVESTLSQKMGP